jgi:hypothetical protein
VTCTPGRVVSTAHRDRPASGITAIFNSQQPAVRGVNWALHIASFRTLRRGLLPVRPGKTSTSCSHRRSARSSTRPTSSGPAVECEGGWSGPGRMDLSGAAAQLRLAPIGRGPAVGAHLPACRPTARQRSPRRSIASRSGRPSPKAPRRWTGSSPSLATPRQARVRSHSLSHSERRKALLRSRKRACDLRRGGGI